MLGGYVQGSAGDLSLRIYDGFWRCLHFLGGVIFFGLIVFALYFCFTLGRLGRLYRRFVDGVDIHSYLPKWINSF